MNRINRYHKRATTNFLLCKKIYLMNLRNPITELLCQKAHGEARIWSAIRETIRNGYKKVGE